VERLPRKQQAAGAKPARGSFINILLVFINSLLIAFVFGGKRLFGFGSVKSCCLWMWGDVVLIGFLFGLSLFCCLGCWNLAVKLWVTDGCF
jgi:hypothetical protein